MSAPSPRLTNPRIPRFNTPRPSAIATPEPPTVPDAHGHEFKAQEIARLAYSFWEARGCKEVRRKWTGSVQNWSCGVL
jgi:hypothetical protein